MSTLHVMTVDNVTGRCYRRGVTTESTASSHENALVSRVLRVFDENVTHRSTSGVDGLLMSALAAWSRKPTDEEVQLFRSMGVKPGTYDSLTRVKLVQIMAVLNRVFGQLGDKSWGFKPSPDPILPTDVQAKIVRKYAQEGLQLAKASGAMAPEELAEYVTQALEANEKQIAADRLAYAAERCERLERVADDILLEAKFSISVIRRFIANLTKFGTGVIIGPCEEPTVDLVLRGEEGGVKYVPEIRKPLRFRVPSTMDVYPAPGSVEADDADLCIRERYTRAELARASAAEGKGGWRQSVIREILAAYLGVDVGQRTMTDGMRKAAELGETPGTTRQFEAVRWFGMVTGEDLKELGISSDGIANVKAENYYDAEVVVLASRVIYARVCDPAVGRPVVKTTFYGDTAQFFGWSPASQIDNCQSLMNLAVAGLKKQLQMSGLPPTVVSDYSSFVDADRPGAFALAPGKVFLRNANAFAQAGQQGPAIQPLQLPNMIREILALFEAIARLADDASGFNRNMLGSGNFAGAARTATGLMQIQEAASIIATFVIGNIDATAIVPVLMKVVAWINAHHPDRRVKGDAQIIARGQLSKVMKAAEQQIISGGFQSMLAGVLPQLLGPEKLFVALRSYLKSMDYPDADKIIPDEARQQFLATMADAERSMALIAQAQQGAEQGGGQGGMGGGQGGGQQALPQQAMKEAGMGRESGVAARRGVA